MPRLRFEGEIVARAWRKTKKAASPERTQRPGWLVRKVNEPRNQMSHAHLTRFGVDLQAGAGVPSSATKCSAAYKTIERNAISRGGGLSSLAPSSRAIFTDLVSAEIRAPGWYLIQQQQPTSRSIRCSRIQRSEQTNAEEGQLSLRLRALRTEHQGNGCMYLTHNPLAPSAAESDGGRKVGHDDDR
jgi:hypothetical protein